jgi:hypothetical protein
VSGTQSCTSRKPARLMRLRYRCTLRAVELFFAMTCNMACYAGVHQSAATRGTAKSLDVPIVAGGLFRPALELPKENYIDKSPRGGIVSAR